MRVRSNTAQTDYYARMKGSFKDKDLEYRCPPESDGAFKTSTTVGYFVYGLSSGCPDLYRVKCVHRGKVKCGAGSLCEVRRKLMAKGVV